MRGKFLELDDVRLYYEVQKPAAGLEGRAMVFLHGYSVNHTLFNRQISHFASQGKGCIAPDQRGDGRSTHSTKKQDYSLGNFTSDLEQIVAAEGVEKAVVVGHSAGGMVAQEYAAKHPDKVQALVLIATSYNFRETFVECAESRAKAKMLLFISPLLPVLETSCNMLGGLFSGDRSGYYPDYARLKFKAMSDVRFDFEMALNKSRQQLMATHALGQAIMEWDTSEVAAKITVPTLLVYGGSDWLVPPKTAYELQEMIPGARHIPPLIVPNARHGVPFQHPEAVTAAMEKFLV